MRLYSWTRREERQDYAGRCALMCATPRKQDDAQPDLNARTDTERAMRGLILVAVGAASLAAGGFIALRRAHVERARSGRVTVPTVIAAFVAYLGPSVCSLLASWWSAWLLPLPRGLAYPVLCQNSAHLK